MYPHPWCMGISRCRGSTGTAEVCWGARGAWEGVVIQRGWQQWQGDGDQDGTEKAVVVAWREWQWWHGEGSGSGTERVAVVARRGQQQWHREGGQTV